MSDEIKGILRILKAKKTRYEYCLKENISYNDESYEAHLLLNYITNLQQENADYKSRVEKAIEELFELKDMIYKPETREENFPIQRKISSIIINLGGAEDSNLH